MSWWAFFFTLIGVCWLSGTIIGAIDRIDR